MRVQEIDALVQRSRSTGVIAALEEYDETGHLPFEKERISFTIERRLLKKFREKYKSRMSEMVEDHISELVSD